MYERFFEFIEAPFNQTPDPRFFFSSSKHEEACAHVLYGIRGRKGFIVVTGEVGTGKTTLCRVLLDKLDRRVRTSLIFNPSLTTTELLQTINQDFGLPASSTSKKELLDELNRFLLDNLPGGGNATLLIDEAQALSVECLEEVRMLSNLETDKEKLLQIVLIGQPELARKLALPELRQLNQRVTLRSHLEPLDLEETRVYINHRIQVAGGTNKVLFTPRAIEEIYRISRGIPRVINAVCDKALLAGFVKETRVITDAMVTDVEGELGSLPVSLPRRAGPALHRLGPFEFSASGAAVLSALALATVLVWWLLPQPVPLGRVPFSLPAAPIQASSQESPGKPGWRAQLGVFQVDSQDLAERAAWLTLLGRWGRLPEGDPDFLLTQEPEKLIERAGLAQTEVPFDLVVLERLDLPALVTWLSLPDAVRRTVVLAGMAADQVTVLDPLVGRQDIARSEFLRSVGPVAQVVWQPLPGIMLPLRSDGADPSVAELQRVLQSQGFYNGAADGHFGDRTKEAVRGLQRKMGLAETGVFGALSYAALSRLVASENSPSLHAGR